MRKSAKILILTLGTGKLSDSGVAEYKETQYTIDGKPYCRNGIEMKTNFVAEPIIDFFEPDEIFVLGTAKSSWHLFYASAVTTDNADESYRTDKNYVRLREIQKTYGITTSSQELVTLGEEITGIFKGIDKWCRYSDKTKLNIHVLLTKYGINDSELKENYTILKGIEKYLENGVDYEIAFDITHSFRSLPVYNLIILNYIKNITNYNINISHIYYGNLDASHDLDGKAPIIDLIDLETVLDLTNGVAEFKDTGNAGSLIEMIDNEDPLKAALTDFDVATQLNVFDIIKDKLFNLIKLIKTEYGDARFTGVREMIETVLGEKFFENKGRMSASEIENISDTDLKFMLTKWFFNQNRIGLGLATGLEALRDINTPAFMTARGFAGENERVYREGAETYFINIADRLKEKKDKTPLERAACELGNNLHHYKDIRNIFAHSLNNQDKMKFDEIGDDIENFRRNLDTLKREYDKDNREYGKLFINTSLKQAGKFKGDKAAKCRVILNLSEDMNGTDYKKFTRSKSNIKYDVYYLENSVKKYISDGIGNKNYQAVEKAYFLAKYLEVNMPYGYEEVQLVILDCKQKEKEIIFRMFLECVNFDGIVINIYTGSASGNVFAAGKCGIHTSLENYETDFANKNIKFQSYMDKPLEHYKSN